MEDAAPGMRSTDAARIQRRRTLAPGQRRFDSDGSLITAVRGGSEQAFAVLYERHLAPVRGLCRSMLGSSEEADDAVQHAFTAAYIDIMRSGKPIVLRPWLLTIARHRCLTVIGSRRLEGVAPLHESASPAFTLEVDVREELRAVMEDITRLPEDQRLALVLREIGDASYEEIARILEAPAARGRTLVFQARSSLRASRRAREIPCAEIRERLAISRGGALRRSELRHHLRQCDGCRAFAAEARARRGGITSLLPLGPIVAFKRTAFGAFFTSSGGGGAALLEGGAAIKTLVTTIAIAGGGGVAGVVASGGFDVAPKVPRAVLAAGVGPAGAVASDRRAASAGGAGDRARIGAAGSAQRGQANPRRGADRARPAEEAVIVKSGADAPAQTGAPHTATGGSEPAEAPRAPGGGGGKPDAPPADNDSGPAPTPAAHRRPPGQDVAVSHGNGPSQSAAGAHGHGAVGPPARVEVPPGAPSVPGGGGGPQGQGSGGSPGQSGGPPGQAPGVAAEPGGGPLGQGLPRQPGRAG